MYPSFRKFNVTAWSPMTNSLVTILYIWNVTWSRGGTSHNRTHSGIQTDNGIDRYIFIIHKAICIPLYCSFIVGVCIHNETAVTCTSQQLGKFIDSPLIVVRQLIMRYRFQDMITAMTKHLQSFNLRNFYLILRLYTVKICSTGVAKFPSKV